MNKKFQQLRVSQKPSLLIVGQTPPPWHGQAVATQMLFDHDWPGLSAHCLRMSYSGDMDSVGRFKLGKIFHLAALIRRTRRILRANPGTVLFYPPASAKWVPYLRDIIYLILTRPLAAGTAFIFHASGLPEFATRTPIRRFLSRRAYGSPDISLEVAIDPKRAGDVFDAKAAIWCPCAAKVPQTARNPKPPDQPLQVLFIGSLQEGKGILEILRTAAHLRDMGMAHRFSFRIVGSWFSEAFQTEAETLRASLGLESLVEFSGQLTGDDKWAAYAAADVFFFPSHYESEASPIVLMEALGSGLPVVSTDWRGIPAMTDGCKAVTLLPVRRADLFAKALGALDAGRGGFAELSVHARDHYENCFMPEHFLGRIERSLAKFWRTAPRDPSADPKIIQVFNRYSASGGEEIWVDEMPDLAADSMSIRTLRFESSSWIKINAPNRFSQLRLMWNNPASTTRLRAKHREEPADALIFHNLIPVASFGMYEEAARLKLPILQYCHNFRPFSPSGTMWIGGHVVPDALSGNTWPEIRSGAWSSSILKTAVLSYYLDRFEKSGALARVNRWIAVSTFMRERLLEAGLPPERVVTLRHCWNARPASPDHQDAGYYLFLGRLVEEKGIRVLLDAWDILLKLLGADCPRLLIAGSGPMDAEVSARVRHNPIAESVGFVSGKHKDRLIAGCRAILAPSLWWEPLGLIVFEAYDSGKPVLAARSGGLVETVEGSKAGFLHTPGDPEDLANGVIRLEQAGSDGRRELGLLGRQWLIHHADPAVWRESLKTIVMESIAEGPL